VSSGGYHTRTATHWQRIKQCPIIVGAVVVAASANGFRSTRSSSSGSNLGSTGGSSGGVPDINRDKETAQNKSAGKRAKDGMGVRGRREVRGER
jgi:hypothetical protein